MGRAYDHALHIEAGQVEAVGIEAAGRHDLLDLGDADFGRGRHRLVEIARGLAKDEVPRLVGLPPLDDRKVGKDAAFEATVLPVAGLDLLALGDRGAAPGQNGRTSGWARSAADRAI